MQASQREEARNLETKEIARRCFGPADSLEKLLSTCPTPASRWRRGALRAFGDRMILLGLLRTGWAPVWGQGGRVGGVLAPLAANAHSTSPSLGKLQMPPPISKYS